jgi:RNA polymerase sigma factor (sigma-70 family)
MNYKDWTDAALIQACLDGSRQALEFLIKRHQHFIYNISLKMVLNPADAEDVTQEILIKIITKLAQFEGKSDFRTWLYRIVVNHILQMKRQKMETVVVSFEEYGHALDAIPNHDLTEMEQQEMREFVEEAKIGCMSGMLLCLDRAQRLVYVLGEIFDIDHVLGSEILEISKDNFRQRLSRARRDLYNFMNSKCGLINTANPCRCVRKTKAFIHAGWVDKEQLKFNTSYLKKISELSPQKSHDLNDLTERAYADLFKNHPFQEKEHDKKVFHDILSDDKVKDIFDFN